MRLLIEIPDEIYKTVQDSTYCGSLYEELKNGIPQETVTEFADRCRECGREKVLNKIRAEILNFKEKCNASDYLGCGILEIIDKYKAESGDEE